MDFDVSNQETNIRHSLNSNVPGLNTKPDFTNHYIWNFYHSDRFRNIFIHATISKNIKFATAFAHISSNIPSECHNVRGARNQYCAV